MSFLTYKINTNKKILEKKALPRTIIVDESISNFPNNPDKPNKKTAKWISIKFLFFAFTYNPPLGNDIKYM